jgi:ABC-type transport system substrate-binding protein
MAQKQTKEAKGMAISLELAVHRRSCLFWTASFPSLASVLVLIFLLFITTGSAGSESPRRGGTLRLGQESDFTTLDPAVALHVGYWAMQRLLFRGLLEYDDANQLVGEHAQSWSVSEDKQTYTFHLRAGIRFAHGREVEAQDYVYSLERVINPKSSSQGMAYLTKIRGASEFIKGTAAHVAGLRALDRHTLIIELAEPSFVFAFKLAMPFTFPVPRELVEPSERAFRQRLIGSGPYVVKEHIPGLRWRLARNPHYAGADGFPDKVVVEVSGDDYLQTMMVERGELDLSSLSVQDWLRLQRDDRWRHQVRSVFSANVLMLCMNTELKPFDDVRVRRAVNHALGRQRLAKLVRPATVAHGIVPPGMPWENPELRPYDHDPQAARALLREAGYANGFEVELWYPQTFLGRLPEAIQEDLRQVGIQINLRPGNPSSVIQKAGQRGQVALSLSGWVVDYPDPSSFFDPTLNGAKIAESDGSNFSFYNSSEVNRLILEADRTFDAPERLTLLRRMEAIVMEDAPWAPLVHSDLTWLCHPRLQGFQAHPLWSLRLEKLWLRDESSPSSHHLAPPPKKSH